MIRHPGLKALQEPSSNISVRASARLLAYATAHHQWPRLYLGQAGSGHQISIMLPKLAGCSQRSEANIKQRSFHFQWAIMQQHLDERPCETFFFSLPPHHKAALGYINVDPPHPLTGWKGHSCLLSWHTARNRTSHLPTTPPPSLFANDAEIGNHFVFSVIINIWRPPSGCVVVWWAWPWLLVQKKKEKKKRREMYKCASRFRLGYFWWD